MTKRELNKLKKIILPLLALSFFIASKCNEYIEPIHKEIDKGNLNANTEYCNVSTRLEMPRLKEGNSMFLVKQVPEYGVNFCVEYDCLKRASRWIAFRWDINNTTNKNVGRNEKWSEDNDIPEEYRVKLSDHINDNYDRGHMMASEDRQNSKEANAQTFLMTNIHPQFNKFNGSSAGRSYVWVNLEKRVRKFYENWTKEQNGQDTIYVVKGGTIDKDEQILEITKKGLVVPKYFFMAFLYKNNQPTLYGYKAMAFWIEHTDGVDTTSGDDLKKYMISIDQLEEYTGIDFFCNLPDKIEDIVEANTEPKDWGFN